MKKSIISILLLCLLVLTGCRASYTAEVTDPANRTSASAAEQTHAEDAPALAQEQAELTAEEAQSIALEQAGLTAEQVTGLRAEYDLEDGVPLYEVSFRADGWEYEYEIHAQTGKVLSFDRDRD